MSKNNGRMQVVALQTSLAAALADNQQLSEALRELGYCHAQQAAFITDSASGPDGLISREILFNENKIALAEAVETNKRLTEDLEFQAHRYTLLQGEVRSRSVALVDAAQEINRLKIRVNNMWLGGRVVVAVLAIPLVALSLKLAGVF